MGPVAQINFAKRHLAEAKTDEERAEVLGWLCWSDECLDNLAANGHAQAHEVAAAKTKRADARTRVIVKPGAK